jgi:hypothetical protein
VSLRTEGCWTPTGARDWAESFRDLLAKRSITSHPYGGSRELDRPTSMSSRAPNVGELLPRAAEAFGVRYKLATYSLDIAHEKGGPKARGFELILGITIEAIDYLEAQIMARILDTPVSEVRDNLPHGINNVVDIQVRESARRPAASSPSGPSG